MSFIEEFVKIALTAEQSFVMKKNNNYVSFFYDEVGKAKYVFARVCYRSEDVVGLSSPSLNPKLVAIVADDMVYIVDNYFFGMMPGDFTDCDIDHMVSFNNACNKAARQIKEEIFPALFEDLVVDKALGKRDLELCKKQARSCLLNNVKLEYDECYIKFGQDEFAQVLCGFATVKEFAESDFQNNVDGYRLNKAYTQAVLTFMGSPDIANEWEKRLAKGLNSVNAKTVTVEFSANGKTGSAKMEPHIILKALVETNYFCDFDFVTTAKGNELIENLGVAENGFDDTGAQHLTCEQIAKVSYGSKVLFKR